MAGLINIPTASPLPGLTMITDINAAFAALATMVQSGSAPTAGSLGLGSLSGIWWHDTTNKAIDLRDQADSVWMSALFVDETGKHVGGADTAGTWMTVGGTGNAITLTLPNAPAGYAIGQKFGFKATAANSGATTVNVNGLGAKNIFKKTPGGAAAALTGGEIQVADIVEVEYDGTQFQICGGLATGITSSALRGYIGGLTLSNDGGSPNTVIDIAAGVCTDTTFASVMSIAAFTKTTGAWALGSGNGGLDTGAVAINTWYHVYIIQRPDTLVVDALISTSATAPTMPTNYTLKRRIGSFKTATGTTNILTFKQIADTFYWGASVLDLNATAPVNTGTLFTVSTPLGVKCAVIMNIGAGGSDNVMFTSPDQPDEAPSATAAPLGTMSLAITEPVNGLYTNTNSQLRYRSLIGGATTRAATIGWVDHRGRFD